MFFFSIVKWLIWRNQIKRFVCVSEAKKVSNIQADLKRFDNYTTYESYDQNKMREQETGLWNSLPADC